MGVPPVPVVSAISAGVEAADTKAAGRPRRAQTMLANSAAVSVPKAYLT